MIDIQLTGKKDKIMEKNVTNLKIRILSLILTVALVVTMMPMNVLATDNTESPQIVKSGTCGENVTYTLDELGTLTIIGSGAMYDYTTSSSKCAPWFPIAPNVKAIVIQNGITEIGNCAFYNCYTRSVEIPNSVTRIGEQAFVSCDYLESVTIPDSVTSIEKRAFYGSKLTSISLGNGVTTIGEDAFDCFFLTSVYIKSLKAWCDINFNNQHANPLNEAENLYLNGNLVTDLIIPDDVTNIGNYAFCNYDGLTSVSIGNGVTNIGNYAFYCCDNLATITMGNSVTSIGWNSFYGCDGLTSVTIPDSVTTIGPSAFQMCRYLNSVNIGSSVADICHGAFYNCVSLTSINIPDSVKTIGDSAFSYCTGLSTITLGNGLTNIGSNAFYMCTKLKNIFYAGSTTDKNNITIGSFNSAIQDVVWHYETKDHINSDWIVETHATCVDCGTKYIECTVCGQIIRTEKIDALGHSYRTKLTPATTSENGLSKEVCKTCGDVKSKKTIYKISSVSLSATAYTYNGKKKTPTVTVKDSKGNKLIKGEDYTVTYSSSTRKSIGRYSAKVTFKGDYSGSKTLYFTIGPKNPSSVTAKLYGYDDVKVSWKKVSGASGYKVYYKKSTSSTWSSKTTTGTSIKLANLSDGVKYNIKVVAYKTVNGNKCENAGKSTSIYTLKKVTGVKVAKSSSKVKVSWTNISGETGYQISKSTSKTGTNIVATYKTTSGKNKTISATKGKTYYYKVRAYKVVDGKKIYGPWSSVVKYKR